MSLTAKGRTVTAALRGGRDSMAAVLFGDMPAAQLEAFQGGGGCDRAVAVAGALVESTEAAGIWTIQSGIFPENAASLAVHERAGFRVIGTRERIGRHHSRWRDTVLVERRSPHID